MDYGYVNARIRGMKSRLLDKKALENLIFKPDIDSLIAELEKTPYRPEITAAKSQFSGIACIEHALRENLTRTYRKIHGFVESTDGERFLSVFLQRWDVQNIKTVLRGKAVHMTPEDIQSCIIPAGDLDEVTINEMIRQTDIRAVIDLLATWEIGFSRPLTEAYPEYVKKEDLMILESALDRYYYANALGLVRGNGPDETLIRNIITTEIDTINIKTVLRLIRDKIDPPESRRFFLEGGREFDIPRLMAIMERRSVQGVMEELALSSFYFLEKGSDTYLKTGKISVYEKELDRFLIKNGVHAFFHDPLSIASAVGYFWAKYNETINIRIISRCKTAELSDAELTEELIYV